MIRSHIHVEASRSWYFLQIAYVPHQPTISYTLVTAFDKAEDVDGDTDLALRVHAEGCPGVQPP